jgi:hypothetical protein
MMKIRKLLTAAAAAGAASLLLPVASAEAATPLYQTTVCGSAPTTSASTIQGLFYRFHNATWSGADGALGVKLPDGRTLLTFGDTFQGGVNPNGSRAPGTRFIHNSLMLIGGHCLGAIMGPGNAAPLPGNSDGTYYWPGQATVAQGRGGAGSDRIWIPSMQVRTTGSGSSAGFSILSTSMFALDLRPGGLPSVVGRYAMPSFAATHSITFGSGSYTDANYLYLYGTRHAPNTYFANDVFLARVPLGAVGNPASYQYLASGGAWTADIHYAVGLVDPRSGASNEVAVQPQGGGFGWVGTMNEYAGDGLYAWTAAGIASPPYNRSGRLAYAPSDSTYNRYLGSSHPEHGLASRRTLASYSRNPKTTAVLYSDANAYMPQWTEIDVPPYSPAPAITPRMAAPSATPSMPNTAPPLRVTAPPMDPRGLVRLSR